METGGYQLNFQSCKTAEAALALCRHAAEGTAWQDQTQFAKNSVWIPNGALLSAGDFEPENWEEGDTLFQRICFLIAQSMPEEVWKGSCFYETESVKLRITASCENDTLLFRRRTMTSEEIRMDTLSWQRQSDGSFEKGVIQISRQKERKPSCPH